MVLRQPKPKDITPTTQLPKRSCCGDMNYKTIIPNFEYQQQLKIKLYLL